jgi:WD40 repeat protein
MRKALKLIGWLCLFCVVIIGGWFSVKILAPALKSPRASTPYLEFHLAPRSGSTVAFTPDGKQFLCTYYINGIDEIKRWNVSNGKELIPIQDGNIHLLTDNGQFYVTYDFVRNQNINQRETNQRLRRTSDQSIVTLLPNNTEERHLIKIIGGSRPFAIYFDFQSVRADQEYYSFNSTRRYFIWDIRKKRFVSDTPHTTKLYDYDDSDPKDIAFSSDGSKVLSLWPAYTREDDDKITTVTKNFVPWLVPNYKQKPKDVALRNEINGSITTLPLSEKFLPFDFGWVNPALSPDQRSFAAVGLNDSRNGGVTSEEGDGTIWCYDLARRQLVWKYYPGWGSSDSLHFSPDATMLAIGGADFDYRINGSGFLRIIDSKSGTLLHSYTEQTLWQQIRDRTRIAILKAIDNNSYLKSRFPDIFHAINFPPAPGNSGHVKHIAWSPDSKLLAASYEDGSVKIWHVKE